MGNSMGNLLSESGGEKMTGVSASSTRLIKVASPRELNTELGADLCVLLTARCANPKESLSASRRPRSLDPFQEPQPRSSTASTP